MNKKHFSLTQLALTCTLLITFQSQADIVITSPYNIPPEVPLITSVNGNIVITSTGSVTVTKATTDAILIDDLNRTIHNQGLIETLTSNSLPLRAIGTSNTTVINTGDIQALSSFSPAIVFGGLNITLENSGTILAQNPFGSLSGNAVINGFQWDTGEIVNSGNIINNTPLGVAIDLQTLSLNQHVTLTQNAGNILGHVLLASGGGNVLTLNGGIIEGDVIAGNMMNVLQLNEGMITGTLFLGNAGDTVNLIGSHIQALIGGSGNDTIHISPIGSTTIFGSFAPSFTSLEGSGGANILNVDASFSANGTINNIQTINILQIGSVFTNNQPITNLNTLLHIFPGTMMIANADISGMGTLQIDGSLQINSNQTVMMNNNSINNGTLTIQGDGRLQTNSYFQNAQAAYRVEINSPTLFGQIQTFPGGALLSGTINPFLGPGPFIPEGTVFPVIQSFGAIADNSTLDGSGSPWVFFTKSVENCNANHCLELTLHLRSLGTVVSSPVSRAVGASLDSLIGLYPNINPEILAVLAQMERINSLDELTAALESLAPSTNYSLVTSAHRGMDNAFESLQVRLEDLRRVRSRVPRELIATEGVGFGDLDNVEGGRGYNASWVNVYGVDITQQERQNVPGFSLDGVGFIVGNDWEITPCSALGLALSILSEESTDKSSLGNKVDTRSLQGTLYGWVEPYTNVYIDSMVGAALIRFSTTRNIAVGDLFGQSGDVFHGTQYGAQMDLGYVLTPVDNIYWVPLVRAKYTYLEIDNIEETGAGALSLNIANNNVNEAILGAGFRWGGRFDFPFGIYVPELFAMIAYDFSGEVLEMSSLFLGGGIPFVIDSIKPSQTIYLLGLGVNAHTSHCYTISLKYNLELRDQFVANNGYLQVYYTFD